MYGKSRRDFRTYICIPSSDRTGFPIIRPCCLWLAVLVKIQLRFLWLFLVSEIVNTAFEYKLLNTDDEFLKWIPYKCIIVAIDLIRVLFMKAAIRKNTAESLSISGIFAVISSISLTCLLGVVFRFSSWESACVISSVVLSILGSVLTFCLVIKNIRYSS